MSGVLLDTNVISAALQGDMNVAKRIDETVDVNIPLIALAELQFGAYHADNPIRQRAKVDEFAYRFSILLLNAETSDHFGRMKAALRKAGSMIPDHDIWISALAIQHRLTVITRDEHFNRVDGLSVERW